MKVFPDIYRKVIACVLLVVFSLINTEKALHTHQLKEYSLQGKGIAIKLISANCAICDFQVAKDSALPELTGTDLPSTFLLKEYTVSFSFYHSFPGKRITNKGPPAS